jgi:hypothetical protein
VAILAGRRGGAEEQLLVLGGDIAPGHTGLTCNAGASQGSV